MTSRTRKTGPTSIGAVLATSEELSPRKGRIDRDRWRGLVGDRVAERTRVGTVRDGVLTIHAASAVWAQELTFLAPAILERLRKAGLAVHSLKFRVGDVGEPGPKQVSRRTSTPERAALPAALEQKLARVDDPLLRAAIAEAASYALARTEAPTSALRGTRAPPAAASRNAPQDRARIPQREPPRGTGGRRPR